MITLITGGVKSGKSSYALELFQRYGGGIFIATTNPADESMKDRIIAHQEERQGLSLETVETQLDPGKVIEARKTGTEVFILDCVTMWLSNLMYMVNESENRKYIEGFLGVLKGIETDIIIITNEVGLGVIPENKLARTYSSNLGILNKQIAEIADKVVLMVSGIPVTIK